MVELEAVNREKEARELAEKLFKFMGRWDGFDIAVHGVRSVLSLVVLEELYNVTDYYDVRELYSSARHYKEILEEIIRLCETILVKGGY